MFIINWFNNNNNKITINTYTPYFPHVIFAVHLRSALDEEIRDFDVAILHRQVEGGLAVLLEGKREGVCCSPGWDWRNLFRYIELIYLE